MGTEPKISIIIPVYNVEKYLRRCLDSVLNQTFQYWTAVCVDDGSLDKSGKILDEYAARDKRFVVVHKENGGLSSARNTGLKKVKTPYVMFLDSDDCIHPQTMEIVYNKAKQNDVDIVSFRYLHGDCDVKIPNWFNEYYNIKNIKMKITDNLLRWATNHDKGLNSWFVQQCVVWRILYRFDFIKSLKFLQSINILEDFVYWSCVLFLHPRACIIKTPLYSYTSNPSSILHTADYVKSAKNLIMAVDESYKKFRSAKISAINAYRWKSRFMWDILSRVYSYTKRINDKNELKEIRTLLVKLQNNGVFDNPPDFHAWRYKRRILKLISQIS